ncbi:glycerate kinase [Robertkochia sediminum]|nr:glycerate kinase [Robertkochia sediminum]
MYAVHDVINVLYGPHGAARVYGPQNTLSGILWGKYT